MQRKETKLEAQRLLRQFGPAAYEKALAAERAARRKYDKRLANFLHAVARRIAIDTVQKKADMRVQETWLVQAEIDGQKEP